MNAQDWNRICRETTVSMRTHVQPFLSPVSREVEENTGLLEGSASYLEQEGEKFLITNEHVARGKRLTHQFYAKEDIFRISNRFMKAPLPIDAALSHIAPSSWSHIDHNAAAIPSSRIASRHDPVEHECLFFCGYSGQRSTFLFGTLFTPATPYLTQECPFPDKVSEADPFYHFAMFYSPDLATSVDGQPNLPDPHGFSGSLVWDTKRVACLNSKTEWSPDIAEVTGIVWGWPSSSACILATKIEHIQIANLCVVGVNA